MTEPAKDEAELLERIARDLWGVPLEQFPFWNGKSYLTDAAIALAAIRAAGWAVVPVVFIEQAVDELEESASGSYPHRDAYPEEMRRYERDMELPRAIRAMLAAAPGVKP